MTSPNDRSNTDATVGLDPAVARSWAQRGRQVQTAVAQIRAKGSSRGGEVNATVDAQGKVIDIGITSYALELGSSRVSELVMEAIKRAQDDAARRLELAWVPLTADPAVREILDFGRQLIEPPQTSTPVDEDKLPWEEQIRRQDERIRRQLGRG